MSEPYGLEGREFPRVAPLPTKRERHRVDEALKEAGEQDYDEVVILGFKDGKSYLLHSQIESTVRLIGAIEWLKFRMME